MSDDLTEYTGSCHCGKVKIRVRMDLAGKAYACNCSICARGGFLWAFPPFDRFTLVSGEESLTDYQFGRKRIHHFFCTTCGVRTFSRGVDQEGRPSCAVNVRCLDGVDPRALQVEWFDGKSL